MIALTDGIFTAQVDPQGALMASLTWMTPDGRVVPLLYAPADAARPAQGAPRFGCWPLVPFCNRAFDAKLHVGGEILDLPRHDPRGTIHGHGWEATWSVAERAPRRLGLTHAADWGPYRYRSRLDLALDAGDVRIDLSVTNEGTRTLPFGIGLHPWLPRDAATTFAAEAHGALVLGEAYIPTGLGPVPRGLDGALPLPRDREIAVNLIGWTGTARLRLPEGVSLAIAASDTLCAPLLWSPPGADFICFEPQSHGIGAPSEALAASLTPMTLLAPGETLAGWMRLTPSLD